MKFVLNMKLVIEILHTYIKFQGIGFVYSTSVAENLGCLYSRLLCQQQDFIQKLVRINNGIDDQRRSWLGLE